jgi:hypothetical protein
MLDMWVLLADAWVIAQTVPSSVVSSDPRSTWDASLGETLAVTAPLDVLLHEYVTPGMRAAGWKKSRGNYTWRAANGDRAIVTFHRSYATKGRLSRFFIEVGLFPLPAAEMMAYWIPVAKTPEAATARYDGRIRPSRAGYADAGGRWELAEDEVPVMGPQIRSLLVEDVAPMLVAAALDRRVLLEWADDESKIPDSVQWNFGGIDRINLIADVAPVPEIDAEIERMRVEPYVNREGHVNYLIQAFSYLADRYPEHYNYLRPEIEQRRTEFAEYWPAR